MTRIKILAAILVCSVLTSCESGLDLAVINDSAGVITVSMGNRSKTVAEGGTVKYHFPGLREKFLVKTAQCELWFRMPNELGEYPWRLNGVFPVQFERDLKLYAVPPETRKPIPHSEIVAMQPTNFPIAPEQMICS